MRGFQGGIDCLMAVIAVGEGEGGGGEGWLWEQISLSCALYFVEEVEEGRGGGG